MGYWSNGYRCGLWLTESVAPEGAGVTQKREAAIQGGSTSAAAKAASGTLAWLSIGVTFLVDCDHDHDDDDDDVVDAAASSLFLSPVSVYMIAKCLAYEWVWEWQYLYLYSYMAIWLYVYMAIWLREGEVNCERLNPDRDLVSVAVDRR